MELQAFLGPPSADLGAVPLPPVVRNEPQVRAFLGSPRGVADATSAVAQRFLDDSGTSTSSSSSDDEEAVGSEGYDGRHFSTDTDASSGSSDASGRSRTYRRRGSRSSHNASDKKVYSRISIGSPNSKRTIEIDDKKVVKRVDECFKEMKKIIFKQLVARGEVHRDEKGDFRISINHNRSIVQWWVGGSVVDAASGEQRPKTALEMKKGVYDFKNDLHNQFYSGEDAAKLTALSKEVVTKTNHWTGVQTKHIQTVPVGCFGPIGRSNLSRYFVAEDFEKFAGGLQNKKGTDVEVHEKSFAEYMSTEYIKAKGKPNVADTKTVATITASALIYHNDISRKLERELATFQHDLRTELQANGDQETPRSKELNSIISEILVLRKRFNGMHMNPYFVSKTYLPDPALRNDFARANKLHADFKAHYASVGEARRGRWEKTKASIGRSAYKEPEGYNKLALRLAGKEAFGSRVDYLQFCATHHQYDEQSLGLEETFFDQTKILDEQPGVAVNLGMFDHLNPILKMHLEATVTGSRAKVVAMKAHVGANTTPASDDAAIITATQEGLRAQLTAATV